MDYFDTHCHLDDILVKLKLPDFQSLKSQFFPTNFSGCICISCDPNSIEIVSGLMENAEVYGAFGIHPHDAQHYTPELELKLLATMNSAKTVAWGEIGLDYHYGLSPKDIQKQIFSRQIQRAIENKKPLIIHTREAEEDTLAIMQAEIPPDWKIHVHCFTSSLDMAEKLLAYFPNLCLGFTGIITFKNALELQNVAKAIPLDRFLLETDGPYLAPIPHRGKPAHPGHIPLIAEKMAELKGLDLKQIYQSARINTKRIYGI